MYVSFIRKYLCIVLMCLIILVNLKLSEEDTKLLAKEDIIQSTCQQLSNKIIKSDSAKEVAECNNKFENLYGKFEEQSDMLTKLIHEFGFGVNQKLDKIGTDLKQVLFYGFIIIIFLGLIVLGMGFTFLAFMIGWSLGLQKRNQNNSVDEYMLDIIPEEDEEEEYNLYRICNARRG